MVRTGIAWVGHLLQTAKAFLRGTSTGRAGGFRNPVSYTHLVGMAKPSPSAEPSSATILMVVTPTT